MKLFAGLIATLFGSAAIAQETSVLTYEMFETSIQHVNLEECPGELGGEDRFCRMTIHNDAFHVFAFSQKGEQPMLGLKTWYEDEIDMTFK